MTILSTELSLVTKGEWSTLLHIILRLSKADIADPKIICWPQKATVAAFESPSGLSYPLKICQLQCMFIFFLFYYIKKWGNESTHWSVQIIDGVCTLGFFLVICLLILINEFSRNTATSIVFHELRKFCSLPICVLPSSLSTLYSTQNNYCAHWSAVIFISSYDVDSENKLSSVISTQYNPLDVQTEVLVFEMKVTRKVFLCNTYEKFTITVTLAAN